MGPDCGTSIIGGVGFGFSNAVRQGSIGVIAAAGTGLQEFTCMVHNAGYGISHAIGTGGRDLSDAIGGITTLSALDLWKRIQIQSDCHCFETPGSNTLRKLVERFKTSKNQLSGVLLGLTGKLKARAVFLKGAI